jgi:hypothetical protein
MVVGMMAAENQDAIEPETSNPSDLAISGARQGLDYQGHRTLALGGRDLRENRASRRVEQGYLGAIGQVTEQANPPALDHDGASGWIAAPEQTVTGGQHHAPTRSFIVIEQLPGHSSA